MKTNITDLPSFKDISVSLYNFIKAAIIMTLFIPFLILVPAIPSLLYLIAGASLFPLLNTLMLTGPALLSSSLGIVLATIVIINLITDIICNLRNIKDISIYSLKSSAVLFIISATTFAICTACGLPPVINASFTSLMLQKTAASIALLTAAIAKYPLTIKKIGWEPFPSTPMERTFKDDNDSDDNDSDDSSIDGIDYAPGNEHTDTIKELVKSTFKSFTPRKDEHHSNNDPYDDINALLVYPISPIHGAS